MSNGDAEIKVEFVAPIAGKGGAYYAYTVGPRGAGAYAPTKEGAIAAVKAKMAKTLPSEGRDK